MNTQKAYNQNLDKIDQYAEDGKYEELKKLVFELDLR
jgi:soluble cytochrome b562